MDNDRVEFNPVFELVIKPIDIGYNVCNRINHIASYKNW